MKMTDDDFISYAMRFGGRCRDCADEDGVCTTSGIPCEPEVPRKIMAKALKAWRYGVENSYIENPIKSSEEEALRRALSEALDTIADYLSYDHDGDPWSEDARAMGEMDINDYAIDGRMSLAIGLVGKNNGS